MKRIKYILFTFVTLFICIPHVNASFASLYASSTSVYVGDTFTVYANMQQAAAWNIHVVSSGPVSGCSINQADATSDAMDTSRTFSTTCTATSEGNISIKLSGDVTSALDGNPTIISGNLNVISRKKPTKNPNQNNNQNNNSNGNTNSNKIDNNNQSNNNNTKNQEINKSSNNNIKSLTVDNYTLKKVDLNNYTLTVSNNVTTVNINATAEDSKSQITGLGKKELLVGKNNFEIIVVSESGLQNKINVEIIRKDGYYIDDLNDLLSDKNLKNINIIISKGEVISSENLKKIKNSRKNVSFNYLDNAKKIIYSWVIDGSKIKSTNSLKTSINFSSENEATILKLSNYADGLYISFSEDNEITEGIKLKIYVGDKFTDKNKINIYGYEKNNLNLIKEGISIKDGYVDFDINQQKDYFITMSKVINLDETSNNSDFSNYLILIIIIIILIIILLLMVTIYFIKKKNKSNQKVKNKKAENSINSVNSISNNINSISDSNNINNVKSINNSNNINNVNGIGNGNNINNVNGIGNNTGGINNNF